MISNDELRQKVADILKQAGIDAVVAARNPANLEEAAKTVTALLPFALRPLVKERMRGVILQIAERLPRPGNTDAASVEPAVCEHRLRSLQDEIRRVFGDDYATKRSFRGYDADTDVLCSRLSKECDAIEACVPENDIGVRTRVMLAKAQILGNWQKIHGSKGNQQSAIECYEKALAFANGEPSLQAEVHCQFGRFCVGAAEEIAGGKQKAIEHFQRAMALAPAGSSAYIASEEELRRHQKRRWFS